MQQLQPLPQQVQAECIDKQYIKFYKNYKMRSVCYMRTERVFYKNNTKKLRFTLDSVFLL